MPPLSNQSRASLRCCRKLEGELGPLPYEGPPRAGRQIPVGTGREVPPEVLDSLRGLNRQQLTNMLINYYHSIRGACSTPLLLSAVSTCCTLPLPPYCVFECLTSRQLCYGFMVFHDSHVWLRFGGSERLHSAAQASTSW